MLQRTAAGVQCAVLWQRYSQRYSHRVTSVAAGAHRALRALGELRALRTPRASNAARFAAANREFDAHTDTCVTTALHAHGVRAAQTPAAAWPSGAGAAGRGGGRETFSFGPSSVAQRLGAPSPHGGAAKLTGAARCVSAWREADGEVRECRQAVHGSGRVAAAYPAGHRRITWPADRTGVVCAGMCACRGMVLRSRTGRTGVVGAAGR